MYGCINENILTVAVSFVISVAFFLSLQGRNRFLRSPRLSREQIQFLGVSLFFYNKLTKPSIELN